MIKNKQKLKKIKLLHIIGTFLHGGTEKLMLDILSRLSPDIFDITACSVAGQQEFSIVKKYEEAGIKTKTFLQQPGINLILALKKYIKKMVMILFIRITICKIYMEELPLYWLEPR